MVRKVTLDDIETMRTKQEARMNYKPFMFLAVGDTREMEMNDDTFSFVDEGEEGLDGRVARWNQYQIPVIDCNDNIKKMFNPTDGCVSDMWNKIDNQKLDPMHLKGIVFRITRINKYEHDIEIVDGGARITDGDENNTTTTASSTEDEIRKAVKAVLISKKGENLNSKNLRKWVVAYLDDLGIEADLETIVDIIDEEKD